MAEGASQNPVAAVSALRRAAALAPQRADIWQMLGEAEVYEAQGKVDADAQAAFSRLLALDPTAPPPATSWPRPRPTPARPPRPPPT